MSIEYSAVITRGYRLNAADMESLSEDQVQELYDNEFLKEDYSLNYTNWKNDKNWCGILGLTVDYCGENDYPKEINPSHYSDKDSFIKNLFSKYFPNKKDTKIGTYLVVRIS